jgi:hypothetical protein
MTARPCLLAAIGLLLAATGCSDSTLTARDAGGGDANAPPRRVNERKVAIELAQIATREVSEGEDGEPEFGPADLLPGADVCVRQRRDAFDFYEPFEPLEPPICVKNVETGGIVRIEDVPSNSDLVITVDYQGLQPYVLTSRTGARDVGPPHWAATGCWIPLLQPGALDPWIERTSSEADHGHAQFRAIVVVDPTLVPARPGVYEDGTGDTVLGCGPLQAGARVTDAVSFSVQPAGDSESIETRSSATRWFALPEGIARAEFRTDSDRMNCVPSGQAPGFPTGGELLGLPSGTNELELPVLAGHLQGISLHCTCMPGPGDGELIDLRSCTFAPADDDADAGQP